jgi:hypothetical protein
MVKQEK